MSDASSAVTYTSVYTDSEPWRYYGEESAEAGSPGPVAPPSPDYVPGPEHPPSPDYVPDGDDEPSNDDDDDDDTDDEDKDPFEDEEDDEEEEHLALADSSTIPIVDPLLPGGDTEALEADEPTPTPRSPHTIILLTQTRLRRPRKTVRLDPSMSASMEACIARHAAILSPPLLVPSPPLPLPSPLTTSPTDTEAPLGYREAGIKMRALLPSTSRMTDILEADVSPQKRACLTTLAPGFEVRESSVAGAVRQSGPTESDLRRYRVEQTAYGITDTCDEIVDFLMEIALTTLRGSTREDRPDHRRTTMLLDKEAMYAREAWPGSEDRSAAIAAHVRTLEAQVAALIAQTSSMQTQLTTTLRRIEILEARDPEPQEGPDEAGSSCVATALAERDADRSRNGDNSNDSGTGGKMQVTTWKWILKKKTKTKPKTTKPSTEWKRSKKTKSFEPKSQKSKPE
nr:hypothetical protein [Tanacetum cinerariifolium]